jgi:hypothetical protein
MKQMSRPAGDRGSGAGEKDTAAVRFWLRELRSPELLIEAAAASAEHANCPTKARHPDSSNQSHEDGGKRIERRNP